MATSLDRAATRDALLRMGARNTFSFSSLAFPGRFDLKFSLSHARIMELLDDPQKRWCLILAPRGWGKTSMLLSYIVRRISYALSHYVMLVCNNESMAMQRSEDIKNEVATNPILLTMFGDQTSGEWSKEGWVTAAGMRVEPRGAGQAIRGALHRGKRPDLIVVDDLEKDGEVNNPEVRENLRRWFYKTLLPLVNKGTTDWKVVVIGTMLHEDSLLASLEKDPHWTVLRVELCDDAGHTHWPEYMSDDAIREEMESYRAQGLLDLWFMERRNLVTAGEDAVFRAEMFQWYGESEARLTERGIETFLLVDPAKSASTKADETAIVAVGIDLKTGYLYVREVRVGHWHPDEIYAEIAAMVRFWGAVVVGVETASLVDFVVRPMMDYLTAHGVMIAIEPLKTNNRSKEDRIKALAPYYRQKRIFHNRVGCGALEQQLLAFPRARRDDASDAMAYVVQLLELGGRYFHPRTQHGWTREEMEACYRELERGNAPQLSDSWMAA
jgi:hypothetical protein